MMRRPFGARLLAALLPLLVLLVAVHPASADLTPPLENAINKMLAEGSYHFDMTMTAGADVTKSAGDVASISPMRMRMTMDMGPGGTMQMIVLPPNAYMKQGTASWKAFPGGMSSFTNTDIRSMIAKDRADASVVDLGMRSRDGSMLHAYRVENTKTKTVSTVFLDHTGNMVRFEVDTTVMRFSNFGEPVKISAPM
jgi:hypothetical protein